jgi:cobalt-zinc-cadmium efflux system protein
MHHHHGHDHSHHHHVPSGEGNRRAILIALVLTAIFLAAEVMGGIAFKSLALLGDAAHMLTDVAALAIALLASTLAARPTTSRRTYGYARAEILAALANGATLIAACSWIAWEAVQRLIDPEPVRGIGVMVIAVIGLLVNLGSAAFLMRADRSNINIRAAMLHTLADAFSSVGVLIAGAIIAFTGWDRVDPIASLLIVVLVVWGAWRLVRESVDVLLDAAPRNMQTQDIADLILADGEVTEVHDLHIWTVGPGASALSAHVRVSPEANGDNVIARLKDGLSRTFHIDHSTLQLTRDRSQQHVTPVASTSKAEAVSWAVDHICATHPALAPAAVTNAVEAAAAQSKDDPMSPVRLSVDALNRLGLRGESHSH